MPAKQKYLYSDIPIRNYTMTLQLKWMERLFPSKYIKYLGLLIDPYLFF